MDSETRAPANRDDAGVAFGVPVAAIGESPALSPKGVGPGADEVEGIVRRAASLTDVQVRQLSAAVAWHWVPLGIPASGGVAGARTAAIAHARKAGRAGAVEAAIAAARAAAAGSPGGRASRPAWASAETAFAAVLVGFGGGIAFGVAGIVLLALAFAVAGVVGAAVLLFVESRYVRRLRLNGAIDAAILAAATRDLVDQETCEILAGPWRSVMHD